MLGDQEKSQEFSSGSIVQRIRGGDAAAEAELVHKYWKSLYFILKKRCHDEQLASDTAQDTFIVVISKARKGEINNPEAIAAFIRQTGINILLGHFRKEQRRATETHGEVVFEIPDHSSNTTRAVEAKQSVQLVQQLISEMSVERDKDILISYYGNEEEKNSICARLKLSPAHFDRVLFRARSRLKQLIDFKLGGSDAFD